MKNNILILLFFSAFIVNAQESTSFSLNQAIEHALENNRTVKNATRDIEVAKEQKWETIATGLPQLNAEMGYQNALKQGVFIINGQASPNGTKQAASGMATLTQLLFDGSYLVGLQSAKVFLEISKNAKEKTELSVRENVINAYGNVLVAEKSIEILHRNKKVNDRLLKGARIGYENGLAEQEDVEQFEVSEGTLESSIRNAIRMKDITYQMLNLILGNEIDSKLILTDSLDDLVISNTDLNLLTQEFNLKNNIDYKIAQNDTTSKELLVKLEKSKTLPSLAAFINGGYTAYSDSFTFTNSDQKWFGSSLFGINMQIPIFSSGSRIAKAKRAKINLEKSTEILSETEQKLRLQIASAKSEYQLSIENYQTAKKNLNLAERIENKNQIKFNEGVTTSFELLQAQSQLYSQQNNYVQSMLNIIANKAKLENVLNIPVK